MSGYSSAQTDAQLHAANRVWAFRYDLLAADGTVKQALTGVEPGGSVTLDTTAQIRRTARFTTREDVAINALSDRIRCWARLRMPDGGYAEWPVGTFVLSSPEEHVAGTDILIDIAGYDYTQVVADYKLPDRYTVAAGAVVTTEVQNQLTTCGILATNITAAAATLPVARDWPLGTSRLDVIGDLLKAITYKPLWFDALGVAQIQPYVPLSDRPSAYTYADDAQSVLLPGVRRSRDLFSVPNVFRLYLSVANRAPLVSTYTNSNPASPVSTVSRGRQIWSVQANQDAVDQATLDAAARRAAEAAGQVYEVVPFSTGLMPHHADEDVLQLRYSRLGIAAKYLEVGWTLPLQAGGQMSHRVQRIAVL